MSKKLVTKELPDILPVSVGDLSSRELYVLFYSYKYEIGKPFVLCTRGRETILINEDLPNIEESIQLINEIMGVKYLDQAEDLFGNFKKLHGEDATDVLLYIWHDWRKERQAVEVNRKAQEVLAKIKKCKLKKKAQEESAIIDELFSIGFGIYGGDRKCDFDAGKENVFLYGYMLGREYAARKGTMKPI